MKQKIEQVVLVYPHSPDVRAEMELGYKNLTQGYSVGCHADYGNRTLVATTAADKMPLEKIFPPETIEKLRNDGFKVEVIYPLSRIFLVQGMVTPVKAPPLFPGPIWTGDQDNYFGTIERIGKVIAQNMPEKGDRAIFFPGKDPGCGAFMNNDAAFKLARIVREFWRDVKRNDNLWKEGTYENLLENVVSLRGVSAVIMIAHCDVVSFFPWFYLKSKGIKMEKRFSLNNGEGVMIDCDTNDVFLIRRNYFGKPEVLEKFS
ncbi:MAG: hypothetical protein WC726_01285 [Parcubacteria group bacterium]